MKVRLSALALVELDNILAEVSKHSPEGARKVEGRVRAALRRVGEFPESAQQVAQRPGMFRASLVRYPYSLYFRIVRDEIIILRIRHDRRRPL
jgi:plasmid stabilization system protein ParE